METQQIRSPEDFRRLIDIKKAQIEKTTKEIIDREMDLFEFNLFISSFGKERLEKARKDTEELKKDVREGKIDLIEYEKLAERI